ncbi:MAG: hypothetical protein ACREA9_01710 [Pyrinomonadaceae bacterium]
MADGGDIIIRGGSVDLEYEDSVYPPVQPKSKKHNNASKKIRQITVTDNANPNGPPLYDSGVHPQGLKYTVSVFTQ